MNLQRSVLSDLGGVIPGLTDAGGAVVPSMAGELIVVPAQMAYLHIPAAELRKFVDASFPALAENQHADFLTGLGHRYRGGHDLLLDVPATFSAYGPSEGLKHAGHIIATDFPTKAGIPIPGFSEVGLGHLLERTGISPGWLQLSLFDAGVGVWAIADGATQLRLALEGALSMDFGTACRTFGVGGVELGFGVATQNPLLLGGGLMNALAGIVSTWKTFTVYVDPLDLFGSAGVSALLGFGIAHGLLGRSLGDSARDAACSGTIGALYSISAAFGFGALAGFAVYRLGRALAVKHNKSADAGLTVDESSYQMLLDELCAGNPPIRELLSRLDPRLTRAAEPEVLQTRPVLVRDDATLLSTKSRLLDDRPRLLNTNSHGIEASPIVLPEEPPELSLLYRSALSKTRVTA